MILGESGCGKSTFLNVLGGLDTFEGTIDYGEYKAEGDNDSVELDAYLVSEERELNEGRRDVESPLDPCEIYGCEIGHIHHPLI